MIFEEITSPSFISFGNFNTTSRVHYGAGIVMYIYNKKIKGRETVNAAGCAVSSIDESSYLITPNSIGEFKISITNNSVFGEVTSNDLTLISE